MCQYRELFCEVLSRHHNDKKWSNAIFGEIKTIANTKVGSVGQDFIENLCNQLGMQIEFPLDKNGQRLNQSPWDIKIEGVTFELKTATEDVSGSFQFNHVRYHREYQALLCLGVSPSALYFGVWSKAEVTTGEAGKLVSMEKNANASYKLTKRPAQLKNIEDFHTKITSFIDEYKKTRVIKKTSR
jgi:hypothetical protein